MGAVLENCKFIGKLEEVEFRAQGYSAIQTPKNRLAGCDFRDAELVDCQFLGLGLDRAMFPIGEDYVWLPNGPEDLRRWKSNISKTNLIIEDGIRLLGSPTFFSRSYLRQAQFADEQIHVLEEIASGRI